MPQNFNENNSKEPSLRKSSRLKLSDIIATLILGEISGLLILVVIKNLSKKTPQIDIIPWWVWPLAFPVFCLIWFVLTWFLGKSYKVFRQLGKFVLVGGLNFLVDIGILNLLMFVTNIVAGPLFSVFKGISFAVAVINSYAWNKLWTFKSEASGEKTSTQKNSKEFVQFLVVSLIGIGINNLVASGVVSWLGPQWGLSSDLWGNVGAILASFVAMFWNFVGYKFIVFKK